jgi:glycosyltransferase involved in cell wall biosynthesis
MSDPVGARVAGPAIRALAMVRQLAARGHDVTIATLGEISDPPTDVTVVPLTDAEALVDAADLVIVQGPIYTLMPWLRTKDLPQVSDLYNPFHVEVQGRADALGLPVDRIALDWAIADIDAQLARADLVLCSNERQRELWVDRLILMGRDPDSLVQLAPFGVDVPSSGRGGAIRGRVPGVAADDIVLIWAGGIYEWFDPLTLVEAIGIAARTDPRVRLFFLSSAQLGGGATLASRTSARAAELGILGTHVLFNEDWVEYDKRGNYLLDADIGVTTHRAGPETWYSHRTRNLDYLWAGLPILTTEGDVFAELATERGVGVVVPEGDPDALAAAILELASHPARRAALSAAARELAAELTWDRTLAPLLDFADAPRRSSVPPVALERTHVRRGIGRQVGALIDALREGGPRRVMAQLRARNRRRSLSG